MILLSILSVIGHLICGNRLGIFLPETLKYWVGVQRGQSYLMGKGASLALLGDPSSDGVTIKMLYPPRV